MSENQPDPTPSDDPIARVLRAAAAPLQRGPDARVRRAQLSALASVVRAGHAPAQRARRGVLGRIPAALRPVLAAGLALSLIAAAVVAVPRTALLELVFDREPGLEIAMAPGFEPSPVDVTRDEEYAIVTVSSRRAAEVEEELATLLASDPTVLSVRTDRTSFTVPVAVLERLSSSEGVTVVQDTPISTLSTPSVQSPVPSWGLDRIDAVDDVPLDQRYSYVATGSGVRAYVIDTGVNLAHNDLAGRVVAGWSAIADGRGADDCNGHGTHVAGTIAGARFGVAKQSTVVAVRVLDCNGAGYASSVVAGINWVVANHPGGPGVINLSLGGPANAAIDQAVADAIARGLTVVAAAGNEGGDACAVSPARAAGALTIGATTSADQRASYSNVGGCVNLFAPGSGITSAWIGSSSAAATLSGTSMAAPHVAGLVARVLQTNPGARPAAVTELLTGGAVADRLSGVESSPNLLVNFVETDPIDCEAIRDELDPSEWPDECRDEDEEDAADDAERDGEDGEGLGRPSGLPVDRAPGLQRAPGIDRAPGLDRGDGLTPAPVPAPGLQRDAPRVTGLELARDGQVLIATWRDAAPGASAYRVECTVQRPPAAWRADLALTFSAAQVSRAGERVTLDLGESANGMLRCRVVAKVGDLQGAWSNDARVPALPSPEPSPTPGPTSGSTPTPAPAPAPAPAPEPQPSPGPRVDRELPSNARRR